jgi:hypothetical protein
VTVASESESLVPLALLKRPRQLSLEKGSLSALRRCYRIYSPTFVYGAAIEDNRRGMSRVLVGIEFLPVIQREIDAILTLDDGASPQAVRRPSPLLGMRHEGAMLEKGRY